MRIPLLLAAVCMLMACQAPPEATLQAAQPAVSPAPSASTSPALYQTVSPVPGSDLDLPSRIDLSHVKVSAPNPDGSIRVEGDAGAVVGGDGVRLIVQHVISVKGYRVLHFGINGPHADYYVEVARKDVPAAADGSFPATAIGDAANFAQEGDDLDLTALAAGQEAGLQAVASIP